MYPENKLITTTSLVLLSITALVVIVTLGLRQAKSSIPSSATLVTATTTTRQPKHSSLPEFSGFDNLVEKGLTDDQLTGLKYAFGQFSNSLPAKLTKVNIAGSTIVVVPRDRNSDSPLNIIKFTVNTSVSDYDVEVDYSSLSPVELKVFDHTTGATVFDSGVIDINTQSPSS